MRAPKIQKSLSELRVFVSRAFEVRNRVLKTALVEKRHAPVKAVIGAEMP
jgi:hypothetical protein